MTFRTLLLVPLVLVVPVGAAPLFPNGAVDTSGRTAYVAVEDGIEAIDLETGVSRWKSREASWPLLVAGDQLIALAPTRGAITVVGLDLTGKGDRPFRSAPLELPNWVDAGNCRCTWSLDKRLLTLSYQARGTLARSTSGTVRVDLVHGYVTKLTDTPLPANPVPRMLERLPVRWHRSIAGQLHAVVEEDGGMATLLRRQKKLVLRVWNENTAKEARAVELLQCHRPMLMPGLDGLHVWVRDGGTFETSTDGSAATSWKVYSTLDGNFVARVPFVPGTMQGTVIGTRAYGVVSRSGRVLLEGTTARRYELYAVDLESGKILWRKAVKESPTVTR